MQRAMDVMAQIAAKAPPSSSFENEAEHPEYGNATAEDEALESGCVDIRECEWKCYVNQQSDAWQYRNASKAHGVCYHSNSDPMAKKAIA
ncbi:unnamed protein product [Amoebophrya sp. A25]|nr:unnamed protein product [Amoebophrya sp. A25]|eukprot:GSA25T00008903001.1